MSNCYDLGIVIFNQDIYLSLCHQFNLCPPVQNAGKVKYAASGSLSAKCIYTAQHKSDVYSNSVQTLKKTILCYNNFKTNHIQFNTLIQLGVYGQQEFLLQYLRSPLCIKRLPQILFVTLNGSINRLFPVSHANGRFQEWHCRSVSCLVGLLVCPPLFSRLKYFNNY